MAPRNREVEVRSYRGDVHHIRKVLRSGLWEDRRGECQPFSTIPGFPIRASSEQVQDGLWQLCSGPGVLQ